MSKTLLEYKIIPRGMMIAFTFMAWNVCDWFMSLGAATGAFAVWMSHEGK